MAANGALPGIDVADKDNVDVLMPVEQLLRQIGRLILVLVLVLRRLARISLTLGRDASGCLDLCLCLCLGGLGLSLSLFLRNLGLGFGLCLGHDLGLGFGLGLGQRLGLGIRSSLRLGARARCSIIAGAALLLVLRLRRWFLLLVLRLRWWFLLLPGRLRCVVLLLLHWLLVVLLLLPSTACTTHVHLGKLLVDSAGLLLVHWLRVTRGRAVALHASRRTVHARAGRAAHGTRRHAVATIGRGCGRLAAPRVARHKHLSGGWHSSQGRVESGDCDVWLDTAIQGEQRQDE